jgi:hypothetical protein
MAMMVFVLVALVGWELFQGSELSLREIRLALSDSRIGTR